MTNIIQNTFTQLVQIPGKVVKSNNCNFNKKAKDKNVEQVFSGINTSQCLDKFLPTI